MPPARDLTNQIFGNLKAIARTDERDGTGSIIWLCQCKCGNTTKVSARHLTGHEILSCGCQKKELLAATKRKDLTNVTFERLHVVRPTKERQAGSIVWECECTCGNVVKVKASSLLSGNTKSCGCLNKDVASNRMNAKVKADCVDGTRLSYLTPTLFKNNTTGARGVHFNKNTGKWTATIGFKGTVYYLGIYSDFEDAVKARQIAEKEFWEPALVETLGEFQSETERQQKLREYLQTKSELPLS